MPVSSIGDLAREVGSVTSMTGLGLDALEARVSALEEVIAAGGLRGMRLRRRLRRELRASVAGYAWIRQGFRWQRAEWTGEQVIASRQRFRELYKDGEAG